MNINTPKRLETGIKIELNVKGNIKSCISIHDKEITSLPLPNKETSIIDLHSCYIPLEQTKINNWFNKHFKGNLIIN